MNDKSTDQTALRALPGDIINVVIKGVRVIGIHALTGTPTIVDDNGDEFPMPPQAAIERVAPAEWPPQPGDLWRRDDPGDVWFAVFDNYGRKLIMLPANPTRGLTAYEPDEVLTRGPLTLVHREEAAR